MKTIILIFFLSLNLFAQDLLLLMDDNAELLPPMENLALFLVSDAELATDAWGDQSGNNNDMTFYNAPTITADALNGLPMVSFNGSNEYGKVLFDLNMPIFVYMVVRVDTNISGRYIADGGTGLAIQSLRSGTSWRLTTSIGNSSNNTELIQDTWVVTRAEFNNNSSKLQVNNGTVNTGLLNGSSDPEGFTIAGSSSGLALADMDAVCVLVYTSAPVDADVKAYFTAKFGLP